MTRQNEDTGRPGRPARLGELAAGTWRVRQVCGTRACGRMLSVDLSAMIRAEGPQASLWDRRPPCLECGELAHYAAPPGPSTAYLPLLSDAVWAEVKQRFLRSFGFTRRDVARIKALAEATTEFVNPGALKDLDVPVRVAACIPGDERLMSGRVLGDWAGRRLIYWEMYPKEVEAWRRRIGRRAASAPSTAFGGPPPPRGGGD